MANTSTADFLDNSTSTVDPKLLLALDSFLYWYGVGAIFAGLTVSLTMLVSILLRFASLHFRPHLLGILSANIIYLVLLATRLGSHSLEVDYFDDHLCRALLYVGEVSNQLPGVLMLSVSAEQYASIFRRPFARVQRAAARHHQRHVLVVASIVLIAFALNSWIVVLGSERGGQCTLNRQTNRFLVDALEVAKILFLDIVRLGTIFVCHLSLIYKVNRSFHVQGTERRAPAERKIGAHMSPRRPVLERLDSNRLLSNTAAQGRRKSTLQLVLILVVITVCNVPKNVYDLCEVFRDGLTTPCSSPSTGTLLCFAASYALFLTQFAIVPIYTRLPLFRMKRRRADGRQSTERQSSRMSATRKRTIESREG